LLLAGRRVGKAAGWLGCAAIAVGFFASATSLFALLAQESGARRAIFDLYHWGSAGQVSVDVSLRWDPLSAAMATMITGVGFLIHWYSTGYMREDPRYPRFFAYMNLFVFSMLTLVLADNLLLLFVGWELVGLCSYLLIGFWFDKPAAASAAKKAFITTRIGDVGFMIGIFYLFAKAGSLDIADIHRAAGTLPEGTVTIAALLLFAGAVGKSAQIPLYVWLPDAMEGPTPVSALIHAATMVTAGVYLVVRMNPLYPPDSTQAAVVAGIGVATALYAGILAMAEEDIKRVLAYSTVSQLGFMFLAAGVGAYGAAIFHLMTHAFFKALLFLAAGSVMHGLAGETALDRMGGLRKVMPWTFAVTFVGWAAITGVLPFAGFFSKGAIVGSTYGAGRMTLFVIAAAAAALTAFYMSRLLFLAFFGAPRWSEGTHPHESAPSMVLPMLILAVLAIVGGVLNLPAEIPGTQTHIRGGLALDHFLAPVFLSEPVEAAESAGMIAVMWALAAIAVVGAWWLYGVDQQRRVVVHRWLGPARTLVRNKFFVDEIYATVLVAPARLAAAFFAYVFDRVVIDGAVNGVATLVSRASGAWRTVQSGFVRNYAVGVFAGAAVVLVWFVVRTGR
jgi:NADH-quinone oxidoreductase subunit L